jgi:hypothetical protein
MDQYFRETNSTYIFNGIVSGTFYRRVQLTDNGLGCTLTVNSNPASIIQVKPDATITISTPTPEVCSPTNVVITAAIVPGSSALTKIWQQSPVGQNTWSTIPGATGTQYTVLGNTPSSFDYRCLVIDPLPDCADPISNTITLL